MAKKFTRVAKPAAGRPKRKVEVSDGVRVVMTGLTLDERNAVLTATRSFAVLRGLPVEALVPSPNGDLYAARVTRDLCLVYRLDADGACVVDLLSVSAIRNLVHPGWLMRPVAKSPTKKLPARTKAVPKRPAAT